MADEEIDHDLLEFMRAHMNGKVYKNNVASTTGVLESAERIYDVILVAWRMLTIRTHLMYR